MKHIWVGLRESELYNANEFFSKSITLYGGNSEKNTSYCENYDQRKCFESNPERKDFYIAQMVQLAQHDKVQFMFYNGKTAYALINMCDDIRPFCSCLNNLHVLNMLDDKIYTRAWMTNYIPTLPSTILPGTECSYRELAKRFCNVSQFVVQENNSAGGKGTFLLTANSANQVENQVRPEQLYMVSAYFKNSASVNLHLIISGDRVLVFPGSLQIIETVDNRLLYCGADFLTYESKLNGKQKEIIHQYGTIIGDELQGIGYRGVCGIDFLVTENEVYFIEINARFQASTILINAALKENGLPSVQELNWVAFYQQLNVSQAEIDAIAVNRSLYKYSQRSVSPRDMYPQKYRLFKESSCGVQILEDGYTDTKMAENDAYLFTLICENRITNYMPWGHVDIHPNIVDEFLNINLPANINDHRDIIKLKIALLNQGLQISKEVLSKLETQGGYNKSVFDSIDITLANEIRINCPVKTNFVELSPFQLKYKDGIFELFYFNCFVANITLEAVHGFENLKTSHGAYYKDIAFISGDRLRIKHERQCHFKVIGQGCMFCPGNGEAKEVVSFNLDDIVEVVDYCLEKESFRHILVGGGSPNPKNIDKILATVSYINNHTQKSIYLMSIPPLCKEDIAALVNAGVSEFAFNIEVFDRQIAQQLMPGKSKISIEHYLSSLQYAVDLLGKNGCVRSMFIIGLESKESLLQGIEAVCKIGVQPMLSIFRPASTCQLNNIIPPCNSYVLDIYEQALSICQKYGMILGPSCPSCQNNTVALTL